MSDLFTLSNQLLKVEFHSGDGSLAMVDLKSGKRRQTAAPFFLRYGNSYDYNLTEHARMRVESDTARIRIRFDRFDFYARFPENPYRKPDPGPGLSFEFSIILAPDHLVFLTSAVEGMDDEELQVGFPHGLFELDVGARGEILLPTGYGALLGFPRRDPVRIDCSFGHNYNSLPVFGLFEPDGGLGLYLKTPFDAVSEITANFPHPGRAGMETKFVFEKECANYLRELHVYPLLPAENYVDWAKRYRRIVREEGRFVSLNEKIERHPEVEKLVGAVIWKHHVFCGNRPDCATPGYSMYMARPEFNRYEGLPNNWTAREIFGTARANGFDRVCVYNTGWNRNGFDSGYPTRLPPNPERGTVEEFRAAANEAKSLSPDFICSVHDNYRDVYRNSPEFPEDKLVRNQYGAPVPGGIWRGGRAYSLCPKHYMRYARRDLPQIAAMVGRGSIYIDLVGCFRMESCHDPRHPAGQVDEAGFRRELLSYAKELFGSVATEGAPHDYCADIVDLGAFCGIYPVETAFPLDPPAVPVPFWQLVYHDSVLNYTAEGAYGAHGREYILYVALFGLLPTQFDAESGRLSRELRGAYKSEMMSHRFLTPVRMERNPDGSFRTHGVAATVFNDGTEVVANFGDSDFRYGKEHIAGQRYLIIHNKPAESATSSQEDCK